MRTAGLLLLPLVAVACAPMGRIRTPRGGDRLHTALTLGTIWSGTRARVLILSTSSVACSPPTDPDPDAITAYEAELVLALTREGSLVLAFVMFSSDPTDWSGEYPVDETASPWALDEVEPRAALAAFHAVWEAEVLAEDGLYREYAAVEEELSLPVLAPGTLTFDDDDDEASGTFALESLDVSGTFDATPCPVGEDDLLNTSLLQRLLAMGASGDSGAEIP